MQVASYSCILDIYHDPLHDFVDLLYQAWEMLLRAESRPRSEKAKDTSISHGAAKQMFPAIRSKDPLEAGLHALVLTITRLSEHCCTDRFNGDVIPDGSAHLMLQLSQTVGMHTEELPEHDGSKDGMWRTLQSHRRAVLDSCMALADRISEANGVVDDRRYRLKTYPKCFVGSQAVDWMITSGRSPSRADATAHLQLLILTGLAAHVCNDHPFKDEFLFYRFLRDENDEARFNNSSIGVSDLWLNMRMQGYMKCGPKLQSTRFFVTDSEVLHCFDTQVSTQEQWAIPLQNSTPIRSRTDPCKITLHMQNGKDC